MSGKIASGKPFFTGRNVAYLSPHSDDLEINSFAFVSGLAPHNRIAEGICFEVDATREAEGRAGAKLAGLSDEVRILGRTTLVENDELAAFLDEFFAAIDVDTLFVPGRYDGHPHHARLHKAGVEAARRTGKKIALIEYWSPWDTGGMTRGIFFVPPDKATQADRAAKTAAYELIVGLGVDGSERLEPLEKSGGCRAFDVYRIRNGSFVRFHDPEPEKLCNDVTNNVTGKFYAAGEKVAFIIARDAVPGKKTYVLPRGKKILLAPPDPADPDKFLLPLIDELNDLGNEIVVARDRREVRAGFDLAISSHPISTDKKDLEFLDAVRTELDGAELISYLPDRAQPYNSSYVFDAEKMNEKKRVIVEAFRSQADATRFDLLAEEMNAAFARRVGEPGMFAELYNISEIRPGSAT